MPLVTLMGDASIDHLASDLSERWAELAAESDTINQGNIPPLQSNGTLSSADAELLLARLDEFTDEQVKTLLGTAFSEARETFRNFCADDLMIVMLWRGRDAEIVAQ